MFQIARSPCVHGFQYRAYGLPEGSERVFHARRDDGEDLTMHEAVGFQFPQLLGEHFRRCPGHSAAQFREAHRGRDELPQDESLVFASYEAKGGFYGAVMVGFSDGL